MICPHKRKAKSTVRAEARERYTLAQKKGWIKEIKLGNMTQSDLSRKLGLPRSTVSDWYNQLKGRCDDITVYDVSRVRSRKTEFELLNNRLADFIRARAEFYADRGFCFSRHAIRGSTAI
jgi:hypothetical protein